MKKLHLWVNHYLAYIYYMILNWRLSKYVSVNIIKMVLEAGIIRIYIYLTIKIKNNT